MIEKRQFIINSSGAKYWGLLYVPDDYKTNPEPFAFQSFGHGWGERGSTEADTEKLYAWGPFAFIKVGNKMVFKNPLTGKDVRFGFLALQDPEWSPSASEIAYVLRNDILKNYNVDPNCVSITGLSAGGQETLNSITNPDILGLYCVAIPMSPAGQGSSAAGTAQAKIRTWGFSGNNDGNYTSNLLAWNTKLNTLNAGAARAWIYQGAHGGWDAFYNPAYTSNMWGPVMNIYQLQLVSFKGSTWVPAPDPGNTVKAVINIPDGSIITTNPTEVNGLESINVGSAYDAYKWQVVPTINIPGIYNVNFEGGIYGAKKKIINLVDKGQYLLTLTVKNNAGIENASSINFTANLSGSTIPPIEPPVTKTLKKVTTELVNGKFTATLLFSDNSSQVVS